MNEIMIDKSKLVELSRVDVLEVDAKDLVDVMDIEIKTNLSRGERICNYIQQIKNPYCYLSHGVVVKLSFAGKKQLDDCLSACFSIEV